MGRDVIYQICERDFYFGVAHSGISVRRENGIYKELYFKPFGDSVERASILKNIVIYFQEIVLLEWDRIEKLSGREIFIKELPEVIQNTNGDDRVVMT